MKFTLTFKTPDVTDAIQDELKNMDFVDDIESVIEKYVKYGELIKVEFDTETQTCKVLKV